MTPEKYRLTWLRLRESYERRAIIIFIRSLREAANRVPWEQMDEGNYKVLIDFNINTQSIEAAYYNVYLNIGSLHGRRVGRGINKDIKAFVPSSFNDAYKNLLSMFVRDFLGQKIVTVRQSLIDYLMQEIQNGMKDELTIRQIAANMQKLVRSNRFYRWQALRIARTETTVAANYGATVAGETSGIPLDKIWISANDARTRRPPDSHYDHKKLHLTKVPQKGLFDDNGAKLRFPGDPNVGREHAGAVVNCRCAVSLVPRRDDNGRLILV